MGYTLIIRVELISIPAPRMGSDLSKAPIGLLAVEFQSPLPAWGATYQSSSFLHQTVIYFNPRSPHGERRPVRLRQSIPLQFQSPLPAWGATVHPSGFRIFKRGFQSPLPAWGATVCDILDRYAGKDFNPRSPHGERQQKPHIYIKIWVLI